MKRSMKLSDLEHDLGMHVHALSKVTWQGREWKIVFMSEDRDLVLLEN